MALSLRLSRSVVTNAARRSAGTWAGVPQGELAVDSLQESPFFFPPPLLTVLLFDRPVRTTGPNSWRDRGVQEGHRPTQGQPGCWYENSVAFFA